MYEILVILFVPLDIFTRMNSPNKIYTVLSASFNQLLYVLSFSIWIRQSPVGRTMIRVVFRAIYIGIKLVLTIEINQRQSNFVWPWGTIETFNNTTIRECGAIYDFQTRQTLTVFGSRIIHNQP